jgi:hypothetical protein
MVETPDVESAMVDFGGRLNAVEASLTKNQTGLANARSQLNASALRLARALKDSIQASWGIVPASAP